MRLKADEVRCWLEGQKKVQELIRHEREGYLRQLTPEEALQTYLSLISWPGRAPSPDSLSPKLKSMRTALRRRQELTNA